MPTDQRPPFHVLNEIGRLVEDVSKLLGRVDDAAYAQAVDTAVSMLLEAACRVQELEVETSSHVRRFCILDRVYVSLVGDDGIEFEEQGFVGGFVPGEVDLGVDSIYLVVLDRPIVNSQLAEKHYVLAVPASSLKAQSGNPCDIGHDALLYHTFKFMERIHV